MLWKSIKAHAKHPRCASVVAAAALLSLVACGQEQEVAGESQAAKLTTPSVTVAKVVRKPITTGAEFVGRIEAVDEVDVRARVQGFLERRLFDEGKTVEAGQTLYVIEQAPYQAERNSVRPSWQAPRLMRSTPRFSWSAFRSCLALHFEDLFLADGERHVHGIFR